MLPVVMDMFTRTDRGRTHSQDGLGIGLALVKRLAELHGGKLSIVSTKGVGTTVTVAFPASRSVIAENSNEAVRSAG